MTDEAASVSMTPDELDEAYRTLIADLRKADGSSTPSLNDRIERVIQGRADVSATRDYVNVLTDAMTLVPIGSWFHWNHFGFTVTPTVRVPGVPMSNAVDHHPPGSLNEGSPVSYACNASDSPESRASLPRMVCSATMLARRAVVIRALARRDGRHRIVQTGQGPLIASPDGDLIDLPPQSRFTKDGRIVPHDGSVGLSYIEDPHA